MSPALHIGVYGTGAIGGHVGSWLAQSAIQHHSNILVTFVVRQTLLNTVQEYNTLEFSQIHQPSQHIILPNNNIKFTTRSTDLVPCDIILVCVKSMQTHEVATDLYNIVNSNTIIISLQNGVTNKQTIQQAIQNKCTVLGGIVEYNVTWINQQFIQRTGGRIIIEHVNDARLQQLIQAMKSVGLLAITTTNIVGEQYSKLLVNLANSINALSGLSVSQMFRIRLIRHCYASAVEEGFHILKANNITPTKILGKLSFRLFIIAYRLPDIIFNRIRPMFVKFDESAELSMTQDLKKQKQTEVEYINGQFVRLAQQRNMSAPINTALVQLIHQAEEMRIRPAMTSIELADAIHAPPLYSASRPSMYVLAGIASLFAISTQLTKKSNEQVAIV